MNEYIKPFEAFKKLESAKLLKQNVYIYGATGYGKTELVFAATATHIRQYISRGVPFNGIIYNRQ